MDREIMFDEGIHGILPIRISKCRLSSLPCSGIRMVTEMHHFRELPPSSGNAGMVCVKFIYQNV